MIQETETNYISFPTQSKQKYGESYCRKAHNFESDSIYAKDVLYGKRHKPEYRHGKKNGKGCLSGEEEFIFVQNYNLFL